ncbi:nuclear transport factor 2 family protein [Bradyrhizobium liaoningense]|uniref:nuclear transport factor 2 family protein n=1 Tax=Bradyrhizobium liaoningense TaxID=43992 RepID=UPI001BAA9AA9|nr:nuclear transport factor 2 family protein [Bradyrhizobium liaoningense]MBR0706983.1 nuclear transport factor 2 family protein [Bradyrhizobium liaoningense]
MQFDTLDHVADVLGAQEAAVSFMAHFDYGEADAAAWLFADDAVWQRNDGAVRGKDMLIDLINRRDRAIVVRHLISNLRSDWRGADCVIVHSYVTLLRQRSDAVPQQFPLPLEGVAGFGRYEDELRKTNGRWLIAKKTTVTEFKKK